MKKNINKLFLLILLPSFMFLSSCDELSELDLNIPVVIEFVADGPNTTVTERESFCLSDYDDWRENREDIESSQFIAASYWTLEELEEDFETKFTTPNLSGDISFSLFDGFDTDVTPIFTAPLGTITASEWIGNPYELSLTVGQIDAFNAVLAEMGSDGCFTAEITVSNITGDTSGDYVLCGKVEVVLEATVKTD